MVWPLERTCFSRFSTNSGIAQETTFLEGRSSVLLGKDRSDLGSEAKGNLEGVPRTPGKGRLRLSHAASQRIENTQVPDHPYLPISWGG